MVFNEDKLLLELHYSGVILFEHISIKEGNYFANLKRVIYEAFKNYEDFRALVPEPDDWSQTVLEFKRAQNERSPIGSDTQMDALITYWVRRHYLGEERGFVTVKFKVWHKRSWEIHRKEVSSK